MNLSLRQLRLFVTTATLGNISHAAQTLHISQPALTRAIQEFEALLGAPLFHRTTRKLELSAHGQQFLPVAERLLQDLEKASSSIREQVQGSGGAVSLAVGTAFGCAVLPSALKAFSSTHPGVRVRLIDDNSAGITSSVARSLVDLGIGSPVGDTAALSCTSLLTAPIGVLANPAFFRLKSRVTAEDLASLPLLRESNDTSIMHLLRTHGSELVAQMDSGVEVSSLSLQIAMARAGVGVAVLSALGASHGAAEGLRFAALSPALSRGVFLMSRRDRPMSPVAAELTRVIFQAMHEASLPPGVKIARHAAPARPVQAHKVQSHTPA